MEAKLAPVDGLSKKHGSSGRAVDVERTQHVSHIPDGFTVFGVAPAVTRGQGASQTPAPESARSA
jgi:hypothetical protein